MVSLYRRCANVYIGWGHKYMAYNYSPQSMPPVQDQYKIGPEIMEIQDPTFEQEEAFRIAHLPPPPVIPTGKMNKNNHKMINIFSILFFHYLKSIFIGEEEEEEDE